MLTGLVFVALGCGGTVETGTGGSGGTTGSGATSSSGGTGTGGTTTTPVSCTEHSDCDGGVCIFSTGLCSPMCASASPCVSGEVCDECATSSCPACEDCIAGCIPVHDGACDDHGDCDEAAGQVCIFPGQANTCGKSCVDDTDCDAGDYCNPCGTYSCISCDDCQKACTYAD